MADLRRALEAEVEGEVRFDDGSRALYATDSSNYRQVPIGVVIPRDVDDVVRTVKICHDHGAPILSRGGGTSLAGQCCNEAVVMDMSKHVNRILSIDPTARTAVVEPGVVLDELRNAAEKHHLTFGPDPSTHNRCTLGGMIGNNSCGVHSVMAGRTSDNVEELEILTYDGCRMTVGKTTPEELNEFIRAGGRKGQIYAGLKALTDRYEELIRHKFPHIPRRVSGYNLPELLPENGFNVARSLVGSEATCIVILNAKVRLVHSPPARSLLVLGYPDVFMAGDDIPNILLSAPIGLEGIDDVLVEDMKLKHLHPQEVQLLPPGRGWLIAEFGGETKEQSDARAQRLMEELRKRPKPPSMKLFDDPEEEHHIWVTRESGLGATARVPGDRDTWEGWEDSAVPVDQVGNYLRDLRKLFDKFGYGCALYGHFGDGCIHTRIDFDLVTDAGIRKFRSFLDEAADLVVSYGGSFSGEHGDGQSRARLLPKLFGEKLIDAFREFKTIWDPKGKMNPGKIVDAFEPDQNLRLKGYSRPDVKTHFQFHEDGGDMGRATLRCVGVGECRRKEGGTMCPSYMVTLEEKHSTRGRAHLLYEMLRGESLKGGWKEESVKDALDLCLACKGCKGDCPVNVDMATYKAEFLSHYYEGRLRPRHAYAMGLINRWAHAASFMPEIVNFFGRAPVLSTLAKKAAGIAEARELPVFAHRTFRRWWKSRERKNKSAGKKRVLVWPDTFNNYFFPDILISVVEVLERMGFAPDIPAPLLCCGRPLYDFGFLDEAKRYLMKILDALKDDIRAGVPLVGAEPSCVTVFRDELVDLFPKHELAKKLSSQTFFFSEFIEKNLDGRSFRKLDAKALLHGHCHYKAIAGKKAMEHDMSLLKKLGIDCRMPEPGCCGMAGAFGFEAEHYEISKKVGERALLPAVRDAKESDLIIADGFSCREQILQLGKRRALHLAEVLRSAI